MKLSRLWSLFGVFTVLCGLQQVITASRSIQKHSLPKHASKRQLLGNGVMIGRVLVQDTDPASEAALAQAKGNPGDKSSEFQTGNKGYRNSGCYKDTDSRAVPSVEGTDPDLTGFYKQRQEPISKCAAVARSRGYQLFAIQNGGMCLSGPKAQETYKIHGLARNCKDGKGGEWANDVYIFNDFPLKLHIFTGTEPEAGTDANVYITLSGSMGTSRRISLAPENANQNLFEAGQNDAFNVHTIPLGTISGITIGHDDTGKKPADWFLRKVVVKDGANTMYKFDVNRWLSKNKDDSQIERELSLTATITPGSYKSIGCFKERTDVNKDRAIPSLEGRDDVLDGVGETAYRDREFPIEKCADAARRRGYVMFAIQDGGLCATSKEIQNTYDIYGDGNDCMKNGTGSAFSSSVYTFSDEEPGFQDPEEQETGTEEGSENTQSQPALPSDPAMQLAGQLSSPANKGDSEASDTTLNKNKLTPAAGTTTSGDISNTASTGNQGDPSRGSDQGDPSRESESNSQGISGGQGETRPDAENIKGDQTEIKNGESSKGPTSEQTNAPVTSKGMSETAERLPENNQEKEQSMRPSVSDRSGEGKKPALAMEKPNLEGNEKNENPPSPTNNPSQSAGVTKYPVITDTPQEPKSHPGREDNEILRPGTPDKLGERTPVGKESPGGKGLAGGNGSPRGKESKGGEEPRIVNRTPLIEPLHTKVHKIAPETRLPGEFNSPSSNGHNLIFKTKQNPVLRRPFSKLLDAQQRNEIKHLLKSQRNKTK